MSDPAPALEPTEVTVVSPVALDTLTRAELETQSALARKFRRSVDAFKERARSMALLDQETAASCSYMLTREGKTIDGPSIRLAEICLLAWGNLRAGSRLIEEGEKLVTAQGYAHDLENNVEVSVEVKRRITKRGGQRYSEDMIAVTANAACAIALRNAVFLVVPRVFVEQIRLAAMKVAAGDEHTLVERRQKAVEHFKALGVPLERLLARLSESTSIPKSGLEDITLRDMVLLHGYATSLKDSLATVDELFPPLVKEEKPASSAAKIADELKAKRGGKKAEAEEKKAEAEKKDAPA